jgi:hypothetical protein
MVMKCATWARAGWLLAGLLMVNGPALQGAETSGGAAPRQVAPEPSLSAGQMVTGDLAGGNGPCVTTASTTESGSASCSDCTIFGGPEGRFWFRGESVLYWTRGQRVPPLATTSPAGTPLAEAGVLGLPNTTILFGGDRAEVGVHGGFQITLGGWLDEGHCWGLEGDYLDLGRESTGYHSGLVDGDRILARPFFNADRNNLPDSQIVAFPVNPASPTDPALSGVLNIDVSTYFQSAGLHLRRNLWSEDWDCAAGQRPCGCGLNGFRLDGTAGYRVYRLQDRLRIHQVSAVLSEGEVQSAGLDVTDAFDTANEFQGADLGLIANIYRGRWSFGLTAKAALGGNHKTARINGQSIFTPLQGAPEVTPDGLLTQASNSGEYSKNQFVIIPEFGTEIGYQITCNLRAFVGYNIIYWDKVARAGDQPDLNISFANQPAGPPVFQFHESSFWAQGIRLGGELRF